MHATKLKLVKMDDYILKKCFFMVLMGEFVFTEEFNQNLISAFENIFHFGSKVCLSKDYCLNNWVLRILL